MLKQNPLNHCGRGSGQQGLAQEVGAPEALHHDAEADEAEGDQIQHEEQGGPGTTEQERWGTARTRHPREEGPHPPRNGWEAQGTPPSSGADPPPPASKPSGPGKFLVLRRGELAGA